MTTAEQLQRIRKAEFEYCRDNPIYYITHYGWLEDKDWQTHGHNDAMIPFNLWPEQINALESMHRSKKNIFLKARQLGMTWLALNYCVWDIVFHAGHTVAALSKGEDEARELVRRAKAIMSKNTELYLGGGVTYRGTAEKIEIYHDNASTSYFLSFSASESAGRSFTANILLIDEWAFQQFADQIWGAAFPTINRPDGGKVIGISTMKRGTLFEQIWVTEGNGFNKIFLGVFTDPSRTQEWYDETKASMGEARMFQDYPRTAEEALMAVGGRFFPEFDVRLHTCDPVPIPEGSRIYAVKDYGMDMLAHYKIAVTPQGNFYVFHEIYKSGLMISKAAEEIKAADYDKTGNPWYPPRDRLSPPDLYAVSAETGQSQETAFYNCGLQMSIKVSNNRPTGWLMVRELLKLVLQPDGSMGSRLKIFRTCPNLIRCFQQILIDEKHPEDCSDDNHELTHSLDAIRYFAIWWIRTPTEINRTETNREPWAKDLLDDYDNASTEGKAYIRQKYGNPVR